MFEFLRRKKSNKPAMNVPTVDAPVDQITFKELDREVRARINVIRREFISGLGLIKKHPKSVTFFGSARFTEDNPYYEKARSIARRISAEGYAVITGGGPGIMEAGNRGAQEGDGPGHSLGINIELPMEQILNPYVDDNVSFHYFFVRKVVLTYSAEAYIYFPGGFGTLDEFFEILTLVQTEKIPRVPIILVGDDYWKMFDDLFRTKLAEEYKTISPLDMDLYTITEDEDRIMEIIRSAPLRKE